MAQPWRGLLAEYAHYLPFTAETKLISLGEGGTPLVHAETLSAELGAEVYIKVEGMNPTGSFKDRGMCAAVTDFANKGVTTVIAASTGNTSASAAAYAAKAGLKCAVVLPEGKIAAGKMAQAIMHGAELIEIDGNFDDCLHIVRTLSNEHPIGLVNSVNPYRLQGQKTAAFEIVDQLGKAPDIHVLPVGNAGNISAYWMGFKEYVAAGVAQRTPRMWGFQAAGAAPFVEGEPVKEPETIATAIRIGNPASWDLAIAARDESDGAIRAVSDDQIMAAQAKLAADVGIFVEPASAAGIAGLYANRDQIEPGAVISVTVTGNGLKDTDTALAGKDINIRRASDTGGVAELLGYGS